LFADIIIIGAGPAGLQAAIHAARGKAKVMVLGKISGSAMFGAHVENYFGIPGTTDGSEMLENGLRQAVGFGAEHLAEDVISIRRSEDAFTAVTENGTEISSKAVILAAGMPRAKLNVPGEKELFGKGVSYCAECDCNFYKGKRVAVIGDESEAAAAAELMTKYASAVYWIASDMKASETMISKAKRAGAEVINDRPTGIIGKEKVTGLKLSGASTLSVDGVFIELGARSSSDLAMDMDLMPNADGTVNVDERCKTSVSGAYACGDVTGRPWQIAKAVGQGAVAGINALSYVGGEQDAGQRTDIGNA